MIHIKYKKGEVDHKEKIAGTGARLIGAKIDMIKVETIMNLDHMVEKNKMM